MSLLGVGSFTVTDFNDGISIIAKINSNHPQQLAYDPATGEYTPNWTVRPLALTPTAVIAGRANDIIASCSGHSWAYRRSGDSEWTTISNNVGGFTINASHILGYTGHGLFDSTHTVVEFKFEFIYHDPTLNLDFNIETQSSFIRISNGTSVVIARAWSNGGELFKNKSIPELIELEAELIRGVISDETSITYQWQKTISGTWSNISGSTTKKCSVFPSEVLNSAQFRCLIKDTDSASDTYNQTFTSNAILILDMTDPYQINCIPINGSNVIKNGSGSVEYTCKVVQNKVELDIAGTEFNYRWYKVGDGTTLGTGKNFTATSDMVTNSNIFNCEVSD